MRGRNSPATFGSTTVVECRVKVVARTDSFHCIRPDELVDHPRKLPLNVVICYDVSKPAILSFRAAHVCIMQPAFSQPVVRADIGMCRREANHCWPVRAQNTRSKSSMVAAAQLTALTLEVKNPLGTRISQQLDLCGLLPCQFRMSRLGVNIQNRGRY